MSNKMNRYITVNGGNNRKKIIFYYRKSYEQKIENVDNYFNKLFLIKKGNVIKVNNVLDYYKKNKKLQI